MRLNILPPDNDFNIIFVIWADWGFFVFAATAADISGVAIFKPGFRNFFYAVSVPLKIFCSLIFIEPPSSWNCLGVEVICFWHLHLGLWQISVNFNTVQFSFKSHQADLLKTYRCPCVHFTISIKFSALLFYLRFTLTFTSTFTSKNLRFITTTNTTISSDKFSKVFSPRVNFFIFLKNICISFMFSTNTPSLCHLYIKIYA